jgi:hypothetical protein
MAIRERFCVNHPDRPAIGYSDRARTSFLRIKISPECPERCWYGEFAAGQRFPGRALRRRTIRPCEWLGTEVAPQRSQNQSSTEARAHHSAFAGHVVTIHRRPMTRPHEIGFGYPLTGYRVWYRRCGGLRPKIKPLDRRRSARHRTRSDLMRRGRGEHGRNRGARAELLASACRGDGFWHRTV